MSALASVCVLEQKLDNLGHNFLTRSDKAFILHMCIPCDKNFHMVPTIVFYLLTRKFDLLLKNLNLSLKFLTTNDRVFILHMCITCNMTFHLLQ